MDEKGRAAPDAAHSPPAHKSVRSVIISNVANM
jgi:hypothetical protein